MNDSRVRKRVICEEGMLLFGQGRFQLLHGHECGYEPGDGQFQILEIICVRGRRHKPYINLISILQP